MNPFLLSLLVAILVGVLIFSIDIEEKTPTSKRMADLKNQRRKLSKTVNKTETIEQLIEDHDYRNAFAGKILKKITFAEVIKKRIKLAGVDMKVDVFVALSIIPSSIFLVLLILINGQVFLFLGLSVGSFFAPSLVLKVKTNQRRESFLSSFPDALDLLASSLRAGHSLLTAFQMVVQELPEPVCSIFRIVSDDIALGRDTKVAMEKMTENMPNCLDLRFFVTAVLIQREIGGNLAEILDSLNHTIRERSKLLGQIKVQTSQARLSGIILACAPFMLTFIINSMNPEYMKPLFTTFFGIVLTGVAITMQVVGFLIIRKVTNIKV